MVFNWMPACAGMTVALLGAAPVSPATLERTLAPALSTTARLEALDVEPLSIETADGKVHQFHVSVARTSMEKREGLMFVESLASDRGMLFLYRPPRTVSMWMKNTPLSLDMLFVREDGYIENIAAATEPLSERHYSSEAPVGGVIELNAGTAEALGIQPGNRVMHPWFARS